MGSLIESILKENSNAVDSDLMLIDKYCKMYKLKWVHNNINSSGAYFIMSEVSSAIGSSSCNFRKHWCNSAIDAENKRFRKRNRTYLKGKHFKLEGKKLVNFLNIYETFCFVVSASQCLSIPRLLQLLVAD